MRTAQRSSWLERCPLFADLTDENCTQLVLGAVERRYLRDDPVVKER